MIALKISFQDREHKISNKEHNKLSDYLYEVNL